MYHLNPHSYLGLDINEERLCLIQLKKKKKGVLLEQAIKFDFDQPIHQAGKIYRWQFLENLLIELIAQQKLTGEVAISLPLHLVRMQHITLPSGLSDAEIEAEIHMLMRRKMSHLAENIYIDFIKTIQPDKRYTDIFFIATRQDYLMKLVACIQSAGLTVTAVDVDVYALKRTLHFKLNNEIPMDQVAILQQYPYHLSLIAFDAQGMCLQQHIEWPKAIEVKDIHKLSNLCMTFLKKRELQHLIICANHQNYFSDFIQEIKNNYTIHFPNPFTKMEIAATEQNKFLEANQFLISCGLALREIYAN